MRLSVLLLLLPTLAAAQSQLPCPESFDTRGLKNTVNAEKYGAKGDGITDDTAALQAAANAVVSGGTLRLVPGRTYLKTKLLKIPANVKVWGYGATIFSYIDPAIPLDNLQNGEAQVSVMLQGNGSSIYGVTIRTNLWWRIQGHQNNALIQMIGDSQTAIDNVLEYGNNGVLTRIATNFLIARNTVRRSWSDSITVTSQSKHGRVVCNHVIEGGDDGVSVLGFSGSTGTNPNTGDVVIENNLVEKSYWGRGIAALGTFSVTIRNNHVRDLCRHAGVYVGTEGGKWTFSNSKDTLIEKNLIERVGVTPATYDPFGKCIDEWANNPNYMGAIHIYSPGGVARVDNITIQNNTIVDPMKHAIEVRGSSICNVVRKNNAMSGLKNGDPFGNAGTCTSPTRADDNDHYEK